MSQIGKKPVDIPEGVEVTIANGSIAVKGKLGKLTQDYNSVINISQEESKKLENKTDIATISGEKSDMSFLISSSD